MTDSGQTNQDFQAGAGGDVARLIAQARTSLKARDYEAAKAGFKSVYDYLARRGLGEGLEAMECMADLGATHMALKEYDAALTEYARLATIMERNLGEANGELRQHLRRYAQACDVAGKLNEAKQLYSRANDLERRYGAVPSRTNAGSLPTRTQSGAREAAAPTGSSGSSSFAEAIQDAVARSMAKLDNRGKPLEPQEPPKPAPPGPRPFVSSPLPPSPFQSLAFGLPAQSGSLPPPDAQQNPPGQPAAAPPPQGFTGNPAGKDPDFSVPRELSDSQFILRPKGERAEAPSEAAAGAGMAADQLQDVWGAPASEKNAGVEQSGSYWRGPGGGDAGAGSISGTASGDVQIPQFRSPDQEGEFEPISDSRPSDYQSVEESLDKVFGQNTSPAQGEKGGGVYSSETEAVQADPTDDNAMGYMSEKGNFPLRRKANFGSSSSKLRQMQNSEFANEEHAQPSGEEYGESGQASSHSSVPLSYDPNDYDPNAPTRYDPSAPYEEYIPDAYKYSQMGTDATGDAARRPGARRASAEWQVEPAEEMPLTDVEHAESFHGAEMHPDSDSSKAMAQWMVPINEGAEKQYPPIRRDEQDRRQGQPVAEQEAPVGEPKPFDRRQKPKSMKNLRSRFGSMETSTNVDDSEFEESEAINSLTPGALEKTLLDLQPPAVPDPKDTKMAPPRRPNERRTADNSRTNMTPPEMPPSDMLTKPGPAPLSSPQMPPAPPLPGKVRGPRGLLERSGEYIESAPPAKELFESEDAPGLPAAESAGTADSSDKGSPSSMISRLVSKRQHDVSIQNARPSFAHEESGVPAKIRAMVDAARAHSSDGKHADAARMMQKVVNELAEGGLKESRYVADCMLLLSEAYEASEQLGPAITSFHQHALMVEKRVGVKDYESIGNWYRLAVLLEKANERDDARTMFEHALGLAEQHLEADDELTANIRMSYDEFLTQPSRPKKAAPPEKLSTQEVLSQNKELRTSSLQQQDKPANKGRIVWSIVSVIVLIAGLIWFFMFMGNVNKSIDKFDAVTGSTTADQLLANTDGDGVLKFTGPDTLEVTVDGQLRQVKYIVMKNDISDLAQMFTNLSAKQTLWLRKAPDGMILNDKTMFFSKEAPQLAMASEMRRIGQRVEEYYQTNRSYPRYRQDWSEDPAFGYLNPVTRHGSPSIFHVFPRSATPAALFGGFNTPDEIVDYLAKGNFWIGEPELKPCTISCAVKHSGEKSNGKPVVQEFYMHATDQNNQLLPASKPGTVSIVMLVEGRNIGNFDLHPKELQKMELVPMPEGIAYVNMSESPMFTAQVLTAVVPVTLIALAAIIFFSLLILLATLRSKKNAKKTS